MQLLLQVPRRPSSEQCRVAHQTLCWSTACRTTTSSGTTACHLTSIGRQAAGEIYVSIRSSGASSIRDYVDRLFASPEARASQKFQELFANATVIDSEVSKATNEIERLRILNTNDMLEIYLRNFGAYVHHRRTGDADAANHMLAVRAPGGDVDIPPSWLVSSGSVHSKAEHQRKERAGGAKGGGLRRRPEGKAKAKGDRKGKSGSAATASG